MSAPLNVTFYLVLFVVLVGLALLWRFYRWRWRPHLDLDGAPRRGIREPTGPGAAPTSPRDWILQVRNAGAAPARRCRARLLRLDREDGARWTRIEPDPDAVPMHWSDGSTARDLAPGAAMDLVVAQGKGLEAGRYRFEIAVIDGEERRVTFELWIEDEGGTGSV